MDLLLTRREFLTLTGPEQHWLLNSDRSSKSFILHRKNIDLLDRVRLQLDHNVSRTCSHNSVRRLTPLGQVLRELFVIL